MLIQHGTKDRNAVLGNTLQLVRKLVDAGKPVEMMVYPEGWERSLTMIWGVGNPGRSD
ncbi:MAG TPA: prolyl oligopeptidase family serine peptidase [Gemmatimonadales bacterium]